MYILLRVALWNKIYYHKIYPKNIKGLDFFDSEYGFFVSKIESGNRSEIPAETTHPHVHQQAKASAYIPKSKERHTQSCTLQSRSAGRTVADNTEL
jgi:hypothetical protein